LADWQQIQSNFQIHSNMCLHSTSAGCIMFLMAISRQILDYRLCVEFVAFVPSNIGSMLYLKFVSASLAI